MMWFCIAIEGMEIREFVWTRKLLDGARPLLNHLKVITTIRSIGMNTNIISIAELQQSIDLNITGEICTVGFPAILAATGTILTDIFGDTYNITNNHFIQGLIRFRNLHRYEMKWGGDFNSQALRGMQSIKQLWFQCSVWTKFLSKWDASTNSYIIGWWWCDLAGVRLSFTIDRTTGIAIWTHRRALRCIVGRLLVPWTYSCQ